MDCVNIRRSGNIIEIDGHALPVLEPELTYKHREAGKPGSGNKMQITDRPVFRLEGGKIYALCGVLTRVIDVLTKLGIAYTYSDLRPADRQQLTPDYEHFKLCIPSLNFRHKQDHVLATLIGKNRGVIKAPTGYGKTFIMLAMAALYPNSNIVIASPAVTLLDSTYRRMLEISPNVGRVGGGNNDPKRITLATYLSILKADIDKCDILIFDEVHKVASDKMSKMVAAISNPVKVFGMSATPYGRSDGANLVTESLIGPLIYELPYDEIADAGIVADIKVAMVEVPRESCDISSSRWKTKPAKLRWCYWRNGERNQRIAEAATTIPKEMGMRDDPQTLVLTDTTEHALRLQQLMPGFEVVYAGLTKDRRNKLQELGLLAPGAKLLTPSQRREMLGKFEDGVLRKVIATSTWGTGVDCRNLDVIVNASGAPSPINVEQWAGRNSRLYDGKEFGLLIDMRDEWDNWAHGRAKRRITIYNKNKWDVKIVTPKGRPV